MCIRDRSYGVVLLDDNAEILFMNDTAQEYARLGEGMQVKYGKLHATNRSINSALQKAVVSAVKTGTGIGFNVGAEILLPKRSGQPSLYCMVSPMMTDMPLVPIKRPAALVIIRDPGVLENSKLDQISRAYKLSKQQETIFRHLVDGHTMERIGSELQVSHNTLRTHVRRLYEKLDCRSTTELLRLVARWS